MIGEMQHRAAIGRWYLFCIARPKKCKRKFNCKLGESLLTLGKKVRPLLLLLIFVTTTLLLNCGDVESHPGPALNPFTICHINARSLCPSDRSKRLDEIESILAVKEKIDIICISETWLKPNISDDQLSIQNYQIFRKDRELPVMGGGVAIYAHESAPVKRRKDLEVDGLEIIFVELHAQGKQFIIGCCYRAPGANAQQVQTFIDKFQQCINLIATQATESFFILGDFNDKCLSWETNHKDSELGKVFEPC